jgi:hypothetical protein
MKTNSMLVQYAKRLIRNVSAGLALAMIPMLNINNWAGRQSARAMNVPNAAFHSKLVSM